MPACNFTRISKYGAYLLWRIDESEICLAKNSTADILAQPIYKDLTHPRRRREWLAARLALRQLLSELGHEHTELQKDAWGRPYLVNSTVHIGIAHCASFALVAIDEQAPIGVDIQFPSKKLQTVKEKFLNEEETRESGNDLEKICVYWCAKEAIYKAHGGKNLSLKQDIHIHNFTKSNQGTVRGKARNRPYFVHYSSYHQHVLAWSKEA